MKSFFIASLLFFISVSENGHAIGVIEASRVCYAYIPSSIGDYNRHNCVTAAETVNMLSNDKVAFQAKCVGVEVDDAECPSRDAAPGYGGSKLVVKVIPLN